MGWGCRAANRGACPGMQRQGATAIIAAILWAVGGWIAAHGADEAIDPAVRAWLLGEAAPRRGLLDAGAGYRFEYDDNVPGGPDNVLPPGAGREREDFRHTVFGDLLGRYELGGGWSLFGELHLNAGFNRELTEYNTFTHDWVGSLGWSGTRWGFRLPVEFEQILMDGERLQDVLSVAPGVIFQVTPGVQIYPFMRFEERGFRKPLSPSERRDGTARYGGVNLVWSNPDRATTLRGIFEYGDEDLEGRNWAGDRWRLYLHLDHRFTERIGVVLGGEILGYDFDHLHDTFLVRRSDTRYSAFGTIHYALTPQWSLDLSGVVLHNGSNIDYYTFDRYIVSGGLTWRY